MLRSNYYAFQLRTSKPYRHEIKSMKHAKTDDFNFSNVTLTGVCENLPSKLWNSRKRLVTYTYLRIFRTLSWCWSFRHCCFHLAPGPDFYPVQGDWEGRKLLQSPSPTLLLKALIRCEKARFCLFSSTVNPRISAYSREALYRMGALI